MKYFFLFLILSIAVSCKAQGGGLGFWNDEQTECLANGVDVAFLVDVTGSMGGAITNLKTSINAYLDAIETVSAGKYRLALGAVNNPPTLTAVTSFANQNRVAFTAGMNSLSAAGGGDVPEPWEVAYDFTVSGYLGDWKTDAEKLIIVITDAPAKNPEQIPDIAYTSTVWGIRALCIRVGTNAGALSNLSQLANLTGGAYDSIDGSGTGIAENIIALIGGLCKNQ